ncbi:hypothetical protein N9W89_07615 [Hellea sp.]|nr:hypothetical protein [Hellea sp.]
MSYNSNPKWEDLNDTDAAEANETLLMSMLIMFYKHRVLPLSVAISLFERGCLVPYIVEEDERLAERVFIKLTYRGRKAAEKGEKIFMRNRQDGDGANTPDLYVQEQGSEGFNYIMHHKRYLEELNAGHEARLFSSYATDLSDVGLL